MLALLLAEIWMVAVGAVAASVALASGGIEERDLTPWILACYGPLLTVLALGAGGWLAVMAREAWRELRSPSEGTER